MRRTKRQEQLDIGRLKRQEREHLKRASIQAAKDLKAINRMIECDETLERAGSRHWEELGKVKASLWNARRENEKLRAENAYWKAKLRVIHAEAEKAGMNMAGVKNAARRLADEATLTGFWRRPI